MSNPLVLNDALPIELKVKELKSNTFNGIIPPLNVPCSNQSPLELARITIKINNNLNAVWLKAAIGCRSTNQIPKVIFSILRQVDNSDFAEIFSIKTACESYQEEYWCTTFSEVDVPPISCCHLQKVTYKLTVILDDNTINTAQVVGPITFLGLEFKKNQNVEVNEI